MTTQQQVHTLPAAATSAPRTIDAPSIVFSLAGPTSVSTSPGVRPRYGFTATGLSVTLGTAGSTSTTVELLKNGVSVGSVTVAAGATYANGPIANVPYAARTDAYALSVPVAGTGAANLAGEIEVG